MEQQAPVAAEEDRTKKESEWDQSDISDIRYFFKIIALQYCKSFYWNPMDIAALCKEEEDFFETPDEKRVRLAKASL